MNRKLIHIKTEEKSLITDLKR